MKKDIKIGDRIRCASYTDLSFKAQELERQGFIYRPIEERPDPTKRPKLHIEIIGKEEGGKRGHLERKK